MEATEIAMQLTIAWISHSRTIADNIENPAGQKVAEAYNTILTGVYKAVDNANKLKK